MVEVADWLSLGRGLVTFFQLIVGDTREIAKSGIQEKARAAIQDYIAENRMRAFAEADIVPNFRDGARLVAQSHGIGGITVNSVLMGWSRTPEGREMQMHLLRDLVMLNKSVLMLSHNHDEEDDFGNRERLDIWWQGGGGNEDLMLLLAYIIERHPTWRNAQVRLIRVIDDQAGVESVTAHMNSLLDDIRVDAEVLVIVNKEHKPIAQVIGETAVNTDLTILGMGLPLAGEEAEYGERLNELVESVGTVLLVRNAETYDLLDVD